ncbi:MAG: antitoxin MazE [Rubrivivax sp.]|nr:antitoxin MazE family protein [Rubrivivax sp.]
MASATSIRVQKHRDALRQAGLRPVQLWVPDTRRPDFAEECRRQSRRVAQADSRDDELQATLEAALDGVEGWCD